jgi:iron complex outermembrane receptor protein
MKKTSLTPFTVLTVLCFVLSIAHADNIMLDEIVIKGKKESPGQETLTIKEVKESPAVDIGAALRQVGGMDYVRKGAIANDVVLRGLQKDNINLFLDGVRLHGACPSRMDPPAFHFDFAEVEQINIIKGPYDLTNPGGIGGMINAVSKKPDQGFGANLNLTYGSYDMANASGTASYGTDQYDALLGYAFKYSLPPRSGNGERITEIYPSTSMNRYKEHVINSKAYEINTGWTKLGWNPTSNSRTTLSYSYQDAEHVLYPYLTMDADFDKTHDVNWSYRIQDITPLVREIELQSYWNKVDHLMDDRFRESSAGKKRYYSMQSDASSHVYGPKIKGTLAVGPGLLTTGIDYYNRNWDIVNRMAMSGYKNTAMIPDVFTDNVGFFAGYELPFVKNVMVKGGARIDRTWIGATKKTNKPSEHTDFTEVGGNIQLIWTPIEHLEVYGGFGSAVRPPDAQELYINSAKQQGNPFLDPPRNNEGDVAVKYATDRFFVKASAFNSSITDYINLYQKGTTRSFKNIHANIWGGELASQFSLPHNLFLKGTFSYNHGQNLSGNRPLSEMPPFRGVTALRYDVDSWFVEVAENFAARQSRVDRDLQEQPSASWVTTDLKAGFHYKSLSVYGGVYNILDRFYYSYLSYLRDPFASGERVPENGRNFYVTLEYKL